MQEGRDVSEELSVSIGITRVAAAMLTAFSMTVLVVVCLTHTSLANGHRVLVLVVLGVALLVLLPPAWVMRRDLSGSAVLTTAIVYIAGVAFGASAGPA